MVAKKKVAKKVIFKGINKDMALGEIISKYPESLEIFMKYGLHCVGCFAANYETLEEGTKAHGMNRKQMDKLLEELNKITKKKKGD